MNEKLRILETSQVMQKLREKEHGYKKNYHAMFSSWAGGIITDPALMMIPIDDHMVHRGDGIFEAIKCVDGRVYGLDRHLDRLERSANLTHMPLPMERAEMVETILTTIRVSKTRDCLIRLFISRGPGGFTTNPYECVGSQLYVVITTLRHHPDEEYQTGVTLKTSSVPVKEGFFANVKSCNYLPNVLMKKEAVDAGVDFSVSLDERGFLGEGSTENIGIITKRREFLVPGFRRTLRGVTLTRMMELAASLVNSGLLTKVEEAEIRPEQAYQASEMFLFGTTLDVMPIVRYDGQVIGDGKPGPVSQEFLAMAREDLRNGEGMITHI